MPWSHCAGWLRGLGWENGVHSSVRGAPVESPRTDCGLGKDGHPPGLSPRLIADTASSVGYDVSESDFITQLAR